MKEHLTNPIILTVLLFICAAGVAALIWLLKVVAEESAAHAHRVSQEAQEKLDEMNRRVAESDAKLQRYEEWSKCPQHGFGSNERGHVTGELVLWLFGISAVLGTIAVVRDTRYNATFVSTMKTIIVALLFTGAGMLAGFIYLGQLAFGGAV